MALVQGGAANDQDPTHRRSCKTGGGEKKAAKAVLDGLTAVIQTTMKKSGELKLQELGRFKLVKRKPRMGRNPATGEPVHIAAKTVVEFCVARSLRDIVKKQLLRRQPTAASKPGVHLAPSLRPE